MKKRTERSQAVALALMWSVCGAVGWPAVAQENPATSAEAPAAAATQEKFDQQSLALRTALFHDPSLDQPLQSLIDLYRKANREEELLGLYRNHIGQYPDDAGAHAVLIRLLQELKRPEASAVAQTAAQAHPDDGYLLYLRSVELETQRDPRALDVLAEAIVKEQQPARRRAWSERLVTRAVAEGRRDLAEKQLRLLADAPNQPAEALVTLATRMNREKFHAAAAETLARAEKASPSAELGVEIAVQLAASEAGQGRKAEAGARLDALLQKMAPDYPRRPEVVQRRVALLGSDAEREAHLRRARTAWEAAPTSESAAVDLAELLIASELKSDALKVLRQASQALPKSERLEKMTLSLLDRLADERSTREFLENRLTQQPERTDLAYRLVKSLHLLGSHGEADQRFAQLLEKTPPGDRIAAELELARSLRRQNLPSAAAPHFRAVLTAQPARVDLRRELAETLMAAGDAGAARELLKGAIAADAEIENFLDLISFLIQQNFLPEAAAALRERISREPRQFDLPLQLIDVLAKQGEQPAGAAMVETTRALADTEARYRRWLEAAAAFHETFDSLAAFASSENARLLADADPNQGGWTPERIRRYLSFCDATRHGAAEEALIESIAQQLKKPDLPGELRTSLHRLYVEAIGRDPKNAVEVQNHLAELASEDPAHADEYRLKLARARFDAIASTGGDYEPIRRLIDAVDPAKIGEAAVLNGSQKLFFALGEIPKGLAALERLTALEPTERGHWERWTAALAGMGDEERLRASLRQMLAGVTKPALRDDSLDLLRDHLVDSCWRSIAAIIALDDPDRLAETLPLLDEIERTKKLDRSLLWVLWARAWILRESGQLRATEEAIQRLELAAKADPPDPAPSTDPPAPKPTESTPPRLFFPDGLSLSLRAGLEMLREPRSAGTATLETAAGPSAASSMQWAFRTDRASPVTQTLPCEKTLLIFDEAGTAYGVDIATGKLRWRRTNLWKRAAGPGVTDLPARSVRRAGMVNFGPGYYNESSSATVPPRVVASADATHFFSCRNGVLTARAVETGLEAWEMTLEGDSVRPKPAAGQVTPPPLADDVFVDDQDRVIVWRGETGTAAAVHPITGKLLWTRTLPPEPVVGQVNAFNAGAACSEDRLFVYGFTHAVLSTATGEPIWSFEREKVREFPLELRSVEEQKASAVPAPPVFASATPAAALAGGSPSNRLAMNHLKPVAERPATLGRWVDQKGALVAPAVAWAEQNSSPVAGTLYRGRMILSMTTLVQSLSLPLPVKTTRFDAVGGWLVGGGGGKAVVCSSGNYGALLDLARGGVTNFDLSVVLKKTDAAKAVGVPDLVISGPRLYVSGSAGLLCLNLATAQVLYWQPWAEESAKLAAGPAEETPPPVDLATGQAVRGAAAYPRFFVRPGGSTGGPVAVQSRGSASGATLFAVPADDLVIALGPPAALETPPASR